MIITITGASSSGKSAMAEALAMKLAPGEKQYIATMRRSTAAEDPIIARHRKLREGKSFRTWECPVNPEKLDLPKDSTVLLECAANLLANEMFSCGSAPQEEAAARVCASVRALAGRCKNLIVVTNEVFFDGCTYEAGTAAYIRALGEVNRELMKLSDLYLESVYGIRYCYKGDPALLDQ